MHDRSRLFFASLAAFVAFDGCHATASNEGVNGWVGPRETGSSIVATGQVVRPAGKVLEYPGRPVDLVASPDGRRLAFVRGFKLITIGRDGKAARRLSRKGEFAVVAAWSPKGDALAVVAGTRLRAGAATPTNLRVETVTADGKRGRVLVRVPANAIVWGDPVWTPDGERVLVAVG